MRLLLWIRSTPFLLRFVWFTRILLAVGFIPTAIVKLLGQRFTTMSVDTPVGNFFETMYSTGLYWQFLGAVQIVAGVLLLIPPLAHLGAAVFVGMLRGVATQWMADPRCFDLDRVRESLKDALRRHLAVTGEGGNGG